MPSIEITSLISTEQPPRFNRLWSHQWEAHALQYLYNQVADHKGILNLFSCFAPKSVEKDFLGGKKKRVFELRSTLGL